MDYLVICATALAVSALTLFSGFGLGTLLMPAFALFFPLPVAIAATAVVHLANNLFKLVLVGRHADLSVVLRFGLPAVAAAAVGAATIAVFNQLEPLMSYRIASRTFTVTPLKLAIGSVITIFALLELSPRFAALALPRRWLPIGGLLSGFFGGLSGNQGALRSAFLIKAGLSKKAFVGTGVVSSVLVDSVRLVVYGATFATTGSSVMTGTVPGLVVAASLAAFLGAFVGTRLLDKVTLRGLQLTVAVAMIALGLALMAGWV